MVLVPFAIKVEGLDAVVRLIEDRWERVENLRPVWQAIHDDFIDVMKKQFRTKGGYLGTKWLDYREEPAYCRYKMAMTGLRDPADYLLRWYPYRRERLYPSLVWTGHREHVFKKTAYSVTIGTKVPYAKLLHEGGGWQRWDKKPIPKRPIMRFRKKELRKWYRMIARWIRTGDISYVKKAT